MSGEPTAIPAKESGPAVSPHQPDTVGESNGGNDAVCFTAGFVGSTFGAGTIHAYLAADREAPLVVAGISMGAITAAAMQRSYWELKQNPHSEAARWSWFRNYLSSLTDKPFAAIWDGLPRQSDFFADMIPVKDPTVDESSLQPAPGAAQPDWKQDELTARRERYLFVKLGNWLATLPLPVSRLASLLVTYVRIKERVPGWQTFRYLKYCGLWISSLFTVLRHICFSPKWFPEHKFQQTWMPKPRPLFGWPIYLLAWMLFAMAVAAILLVVLVVTLTTLPYSYLVEHVPWLLETAPVNWLIHGLCAVRAVVYSAPAALLGSSLRAVATLAAAFALLAIALRRYRRWYEKAFDWLRDTLVEQLLRKLELEKALVYDFHLRKRLTQTFAKKNGQLPLVGDGPMPVVLVAAPLQKIRDKAGRLVASAQLWASAETPLIDALCTTIAQPALFRPTSLRDATEIRRWLTDNNKLLPELDLVDGNVVRQNPIPALFRFLKEQNPAIINQLGSDKDDPHIHVVYNVPLRGQPETKQYDLRGMNIVDVVQTSLQLNKRRDTQLEVEQTNFIARLETQVRSSGSARSPRFHPTFADNIAPEKQIVFENPLDPRPEEILTKVAEGCRRTLETLYKKELRAFPTSDGEVRCPVLLAKIAKQRKWVGHPYAPPGLPEVCSRCTQWLAKPKVETRPQPEDSLVADFPMLTGASPRIVFVASGGVFRGPFHGGMLACLLATQIRPQMIIGASVGTLMGGALGALLSARDYDHATEHLEEIANVFLEVDKRIAFTKCLKSAVREIGIRARSIQLSPNKLRRLIRAGGRSDPGFATAGAPAALIDALSDLLMIPHQKTGEIAGCFVAGHISEAIKTLLDQLKSETLRRLDVQYAVIGTSLLELVARELLGGGKLGLDLSRAQPFRGKPPYTTKGIAFFGTTTDLVSEQPLLLGRYDVPGGEGTYDFVEAALASSAFPGVFAPRRESNVFPGAGQVNVFLSDGGMFDNLPFLPAIEILGAVQRVYRHKLKLSSLAFLQQRHAAPDLFIAGSLNVRPERDEAADASFDDLITIRKRAGSLQDNVKIRDFQDIANTIAGQLDLFLKSSPTPAAVDEEFIDGIVDAAVLPVFPVDHDHLNPTYAFCASTGMRPDRVRKSIADGCFQTFAAFVAGQQSSPDSEYVQPHRSIVELRKAGRIPEIGWARESGGKISGEGQCPFFRHSANAKQSQTEKQLVLNEDGKLFAFTCPFYATGGPAGRIIFKTCAGDPVHRDEEARHPQPTTRFGKAANAAYSVARRL